VIRFIGRILMRLGIIKPQLKAEQRHGAAKAKRGCFE
jgi:hypothetical protein